MDTVLHILRDPITALIAAILIPFLIFLLPDRQIVIVFLRKIIRYIVILYFAFVTLGACVYGTALADNLMYNVSFTYWIQLGVFVMGATLSWFLFWVKYRTKKQKKTGT